MSEDYNFKFPMEKLLKDCEMYQKRFIEAEEFLMKIADMNMYEKINLRSKIIDFLKERQEKYDY